MVTVGEGKSGDIGVVDRFLRPSLALSSNEIDLPFWTSLQYLQKPISNFSTMASQPNIAWYPSEAIPHSLTVS